MAVIVANVYQQASMCLTEKHRAPRWLVKLALIYMPPLLRMEEKVKAVLTQTVRRERAREREKFYRPSLTSHWIVVFLLPRRCTIVDAER